MLPPRAKKVLQTISFGINNLDSDEDRGDDPMNPPRFKQDYYNWLRDETRKDETVKTNISGI